MNPNSTASPLDGVHAAVVTPLAAGGDKLAPGAVGPLLDHLAKRGLHGVLCLGSTGEFASLAHREKLELIAEVAATRGNLRVIVGCGATSLVETRELVDAAAKKNADAVLVPPPYYYRNASASGIEAWFDAVLDFTPLPVLLYHIPSLTGFALDRKMLERLSGRHANLLGIKDSGGKMQETNRYLASKPHRVFVGSDTCALAGLQAGASGLISACANVVPSLMRELYDSWKRGENAENLMNSLLEVRTFLRQYPLQAALKHWLTVTGVQAGETRVPLQILTASDSDEISKYVRISNYR